jgi:hypothetical protein
VQTQDLLTRSRPFGYVPGDERSGARDAVRSGARGCQVSWEEERWRGQIATASATLGATIQQADTLWAVFDSNSALRHRAIL